MARGTVGRGLGGIPGIEGCRALAAFSVLVLHSWQYSSPDYPEYAVAGRLSPLFGDLDAAVTLFFTLSAFLLYRPFVAAMLRGTEMPSLRRYFRHRSLRIMPAYWVALIVTALLLGTASLSAAHAAEYGRMSLSELVPTAFLLQDFTPQTFMEGVRPAWSLATEAVFYLMLPGLGALGYVLARRAGQARGRVVAALAPVALMFLVGFLFKGIAYAVVEGPAHSLRHDWHSVIERSALGTADLFAAGMLLAVVRVLWESERMEATRALRASLWGLVVVGGPLALSLGHGGATGYVRESAIGLASAALVGLVVLPPRDRETTLVRVLHSRALFFLGTISYGIFLWNFPLEHWLRSQGLTMGGGEPATAFNILVLAAVTTAVAYASYRLVERPAMAWKPGARPQPAAAQAEAAP